VPKFKPFRLRYVTVDCWSIEIIDLDGSVLTSREVKTDVVLGVCRRMAIGIYRLFCWLGPFSTKAEWD
jgi:hypothetical protein